MTGRWVFILIVIILLVTIYLETPLFWIFLGVIILRILLLKNFRLDVWIVIIGMLFLIRCQILTHQSTTPSVPSQGLISPDKIKVNGDSLSGELASSRQTFRFTYQLKSRQEQKYWQNLAEIVQVKIAAKKIEPISGPRNFGEFDYREYLTHKQIFNTLKIADFKQRTVYRPTDIFGKINVLRIHIIKYLAKLPKWLRIHAQSLIVGYVEDKEFLNILSVLGVIHLFSLSGLHVLILLTLLRKATSLLKVPVEWVDSIMLLILPCYGLLVGSKSGIWRAIVLMMVSIILQKMKLNLSRLDVFSITMLICLFIYPYAILEMGGQLSFLLSFAILYLYRETAFIQTIFKMNLVSLPVICFYTYQFNWLTLLTNIIFVPLFTYVILPTTIVSALTVTWAGWNSFNSVFNWLYQGLAMISNDNNFILITGRYPAIVIVLLILIVLFYVESQTVWNRYLGAYVILFSSFFMFNKIPIFGSVNLIDVGQGDSILITTPIKRKVYLIDVGGKLSFPTKAWAKRVSSDQVDNSTIPLLKSQGISKIDKLFLTHKDVDHVGNLETLLAKFRVKEVNFGTGLEQNFRIKQAIQNHPEVKFQSLKQGDVVKDESIKLGVLWPKQKSLGENGDSLTLLAQIKNKKWLFTGDLDIAGEQKILADHNFKVDYLKIGHHGSRTSTSDQLLEQIRPKAGFISAGVNNRYGHPNRETIERLNKHRVQYFNTAEYGMISWYYYFFNNEEKITTFLKGDVLENNRTEK